MTEVIEIRYTFKLDDLRQEIFELQLDARNLELINPPKEDLPPWCCLEFHQCPHCPLNPFEYPFCPVAACLVDVVKRFDRVISYDQIDLEVFTVERRVSQRTTAQRGISSLLGLLFPTSGCPHTAFFKPMVRFHLPLSTKEDTIFRVTGMYLIAQYFLQKQGGLVDLNLSGLRTIYNNMHLVNRSITERLRSASITDSSINAVILLDMFTHAVPIIIEDQLEKIRHWFEPYLSEFFQFVTKEGKTPHDFDDN